MLLFMVAFYPELGSSAVLVALLLHWEVYQKYTFFNLGCYIKRLQKNLNFVK